MACDGWVTQLASHHSNIGTQTAWLSGCWLLLQPICILVAHMQTTINTLDVCGFLLQVLQPTAAPPCTEVSGLPAALTTAAGGSSDNSIDVDDVLQLVMGAWLAQRAADLALLERLYSQADTRNRGLVNEEEFAGMVRQVRQLVWGRGVGVVWPCLEVP